MFKWNMYIASCSFQGYFYFVSICFLICGFYLWTNIYHMMVSYDGFMVGSYEQQRRPRPWPFYEVTLMGQFNYISKNVSSWSNIWSEHINDIVIATPEGTPIEKGTFGRPMFYKQDSGHTSPYTNILRVLKENNGINRLLYVQDDLLITKSTLRRIGRPGWISTIYIEDTDLESDHLITLYRNGTSFKHDNSSFGYVLVCTTLTPLTTFLHRFFSGRVGLL